MIASSHGSLYGADTAGRRDPSHAPVQQRIPHLAQVTTRHPPALIEQRKQRRSEECALTSRIKQCSSWHDLRSLLTQQPSLNRVHAHVATVQLARTVHNSTLLISERLELEHYIDSKILPLTDYHLVSFRPWELSAIAWALAQLECVPPPLWLSEWCSSVSRRLPEFTAKDLSQCLRSCAVFTAMHKRRSLPCTNSSLSQHLQEGPGLTQWAAFLESPQNTPHPHPQAPQPAAALHPSSINPDPNPHTIPCSPLEPLPWVQALEPPPDVTPGITPQPSQPLRPSRRRSTDLALTLRFIEQLSFEVAAKVADFNAQGVSNSLWAYATLMGDLGGFVDGPLGLATGHLAARAALLMAGSGDDASGQGDGNAAGEGEHGAGQGGLRGEGGRQPEGVAGHVAYASLGEQGVLAGAPGGATPLDMHSGESEQQQQQGAPDTGAGLEDVGEAGKEAGQKMSAPSQALDPQQLSMLAWAVAVLRVRVSEAWLRQLGGALMAMEAPKPRHAARGLWALAVLRQACRPDVQVIHALATAMAVHLRACDKGASVANADIAQAAWSLGRLRYRPDPGLLYGLVDVLGRRMASLSQPELCMSLYGLALMGARPGAGWLPRACYVAAYRWHLFTPTQAATLLATLLHMRVRPSPGFLDVAAGVARPYALRQGSPGAPPAHGSPHAGRSQPPVSSPRPTHPSNSAPSSASAPSHPLGSPGEALPTPNDFPPSSPSLLPSCPLHTNDPRVLGWTLWALGGMAWQAPKPWIAAALEAVLRVLPRMRPEDLVRALCGLSVLQRQRPRRSWCNEVVGRLLALAPSLSTRRLVAAVSALRRLQASPSPLLRRQLAEYCVGRAAREGSQEGCGERCQAEGQAMRVAVAAWLNIAGLPREKCGSLESWHRRRAKALGRLEQLPA